MIASRLRLGGCNWSTAGCGRATTTASHESPLEPLGASAPDGEESPAAGHALELVLTTVVELEARARDQVLDRARHDDLRRLRDRGHPLTNVDRHAADVVPADLDLAGVQADPDLQAQARSRVADGTAAADRARRPVEGGQKAIPHRLHFAALERLQLVADGRVVSIEEVLPPTIAEGRRSFGGADDVGEHDGGEDPVGIGPDPHPGQELSNLLDDDVGITDPGEVIVAGQFDVPGTRDLSGHPAARPPVDDAVAVTVEHERR